MAKKIQTEIKQLEDKINNERYLLKLKYTAMKKKSIETIKTVSQMVAIFYIGQTIGSFIKNRYLQKDSNKNLTKDNNKKDISTHGNNFFGILFNLIYLAEKLKII